MDGPPPMRTSAPAAAWRACAAPGQGWRGGSQMWTLFTGRRPGMVGEDKDRGAERELLPPSRPLLVRPGAVVRAELAPAMISGPMPVPRRRRKHRRCRAAAGLALHGAEGTGREEPLVQPGSRMPERCIQALPLAGAEPIQRHREVVHPHLRHEDLLTDCFSDQDRLPRPATSEDDPLARSHRQRLAAEHHTCRSPGVSRSRYATDPGLR